MEETKLDKKCILLRFFEKESYIECFRSGKIRMMSAKYYKKTDGKSLKLYNNRNDFLENSTHIYNPNPDGTITLVDPFKYGIDNETTNMWVNPECLCSPVMACNDILDKLTKISCFYMLPENETILSCLSTMKGDLGDYYCLITDINKFTSHIIFGFTKYRDQGITTNEAMRSVEYVNENKFNGRYGPFRKPSGLDWQREYRIKVLNQNSIDPFWFEVNSLKDITIWGKVSDLLNAKYNERGGLIIPNYHI